MSESELVICAKCGKGRPLDTLESRDTFVCRYCLSTDSVSASSAEPDTNLPCPFCGGGKIVACDDDGLFWNKCVSCGATGPETTKYSGEEGDPYTDWNTRAASTTVPDPLKAVLAETLEMLKQARNDIRSIDSDTHLRFEVQGLIDACDAQIARARASLRDTAVPAAQWEPIESAPRDSTWILGLMPNRKTQAVVRWGGGTWEDDNRLCRDPKHWMKLPEPPQEKVKAEQNSLT